MKVYIAGPMTGHENFNRDAFNKAAARLTNRGHLVLNPATLPAGLCEAEYMDISFAMVRAADGVLLLPGWKASAGATAEYHYAYKLQMKTYADVNDLPMPCQPAETLESTVKKIVKEEVSEAIKSGGLLSKKW